MTIKSFKDGERLVIIVEGLKDFPSETDLIKGFLGSITKEGTVTDLPDAEALPVPVEEAPDLGVLIETSFFTGNLEDVYDKIDSLSKEKELLEVLGDNADIYLRHKFSKMDGAAYAGKLSAVQKTKFFETYGRYMPSEVVSGNDVEKAIEYYKN